MDDVNDGGPVSGAVRHRTGEATVTITRDGVPYADRDVTVEQRRHRFPFGCTAFEFVDLANGDLDEAAAARSNRAADLWGELFTFATLPFYWGQFEPVRGTPATERLARAARWLRERGCTVKGHPLAWHTETAPWLLDLSNEEIIAAQTERIRRDVGAFAGLIDTWDVINEVVIMPVFDRYDNGITRVCRQIGRIPLVRLVFDTARQTNPRATLLLNDFDMSTGYECLIEGLLEAGIAIDALGLQSHMHQGYWGEARTLDVLDRFARFGLPLHLTETTLLSGDLMPAEIEDLNDYQVPTWPSTPEGEARQADEIVRHYRTLLSHPAVGAITYWDFTDGGWLGAPAGLLRADGSVKPAYDALHTLIKDEWWLPPTRMRTDGAGRLRLCGWLGQYQIAAEGRCATVELDRPGPQHAEVAFG